jgi:hypothetical protein
MIRALVVAGKNIKNVTVNLKEVKMGQGCPEYPPIGLDDPMPFGEHKGMELWLMIEQKPDYLRWCLKEKVCTFTNEAFQSINEELVAE